MIPSRVIMACIDELWAVQETKLREISAFLLLKAQGGHVAPENLARITMKQEREVALSAGDIAILPVFGTIGMRMNLLDDISGGTSTMQLAQAFRAALADPGIKAIIFDHDSPGGTVSGTVEFAEEIFQSRGSKPIVAMINSLSASAAYWLAAMADEIVVTPSGEGGALGVYRVHDDVSRMMEQRGIKTTFVTSDGSPFKVEDAETGPLSEEAFQHHKERVNQAFDKMVRAIAQGRGRTLADVRENFGKGRVLGAEAMVSRGMADRIDTMEATIERFGGGAFNPIANANRQLAQARAEEAALLSEAAAKYRDKVKANLPYTIDEFEDAQRSAFGFSKTEAKRTVAFRKAAQRDAEQHASQRDVDGGAARRDAEGETVKALARTVTDFQRGLGDLQQLLKRRA